MTCAFAHDDGAYVLGALAPADRLEFERHLPGCAACTRAVGELAGLPGLLGRVDASLAQQPEAEDPVPSTLLPALSRTVRRARRRRTWAAAAGLVAATIAVVVGVAVAQSGVDQQVSPALPETRSTAPDPSQSPAVARPMEPVGEVPVRATVRLERVTWGTRLGLTCTYDSGWVRYELPSEVDYTLVVRTKDGGVEQVGSWRSVDGQRMQVSAATAASPAELASVEVRTVDGRVVLRLAT